MLVATEGRCYRRLLGGARKPLSVLQSTGCPVAEDLAKDGTPGQTQSQGQVGRHTDKTEKSRAVG